jgi:hypothetical protein
LRHGPDERGAYQAQLTALAMLGADSPMISTVRKSMAAAIRTKENPRRAPELLVARDGR